MLVELSKMEQRYQAVLAVQVDGLSVTEAAEKFGVSRQTMHTWLRRYEAGGLEALADRSLGRRRARIRCARNCIVSVSHQVFSVGVALAGKLVTVQVEGDLLHVW